MSSQLHMNIHLDTEIWIDDEKKDIMSCRLAAYHHTKHGRSLNWCMLPDYNFSLIMLAVIYVATYGAVYVFINWLRSATNICPFARWYGQSISTKSPFTLLHNKHFCIYPQGLKLLYNSLSHNLVWVYFEGLTSIHWNLIKFYWTFTSIRVYNKNYAIL